jgi:NADH dehydrogenase FAD-containing subunit
MTCNHAIFPRVVIIGAGFGGLSAAKQLAKAPFNVTIVDRHNYHLFQPLLYKSRPRACRLVILHLQSAASSVGNGTPR